MNYSVTKYGKPLDKSLYEIDEENKTFKTKEAGLVLDFKGLSHWSFKTYSDCTFNTGGNCTFNTGYWCMFKTGCQCTFKTGETCVFKTGSACTFNTKNNCTFNIFSGFKKIETGGNSTVLVRDKKIHTYLEEEVEIYFENNEILYTENKLTKDKYLMMKELIK